MNALRIERLSFSYGKTQLIKDLCFAADAGSLHLIVGQNGSGKTTLFKILSTLLEPSVGDAKVGGVSLRAKPEEIRRRVSAAFVNARGLLPYLSVEQNLRLFCGLHGMPAERIDEGLQRFEPLLQDKLDLTPPELSLGMRQLVQVCKALLRPADVYLLDEPFLALDLCRVTQLSEVLHEYAGRGKTILVATQNQTQAALESDGSLCL